MVDKGAGHGLGGCGPPLFNAADRKSSSGRADRSGSQSARDQQATRRVQLRVVNRRPPVEVQQLPARLSYRERPRNLAPADMAFSGITWQYGSEAPSVAAPLDGGEMKARFAGERRSPGEPLL